MKPENVTERYDSEQGQLGTLILKGHYHWGYWDADNQEEDYASASAKLTNIMIGKTDVGPNQRFCDLGCGVGVPAMHLAREKACFVDGITISKFQQEDAVARAKTAGLQDQVSFVHGDALNPPWEDGSFDGGWFFESILHMGHKQALLEAHRLLKPGATLTIADLISLDSTTEAFRSFARDVMFSSHISKKTYPDLLHESGFELVELLDISDNVMAPLVSGIKRAIDEHRGEILDVLGEVEIEKTIDACEYMSENLGYVLITAKRI